MLGEAETAHWGYFLAVLPKPRTPFIGRQRETSALNTALDAARKGRGSVHILAGESGIGKTRLTEAVAERATEKGFLTIVGRAFPVESGIPFALFGDGFVPLLRTMPPATLQTLSRGGTSELGVLFPTLHFDGASTRAGDPSDLRPRVFDVFAQLLFRLAQKQPVLVVLENLQWADPSSLDLFHFIARSLSSHPVMVLASYNDAQREENRNLRLAEQSLASLGVLTRHVIPPLTRDETSELVCAHFGETRAVVEDFAARVHARTRGNAFFIEETLKALVESGRLRREEDRWVGWSTEQLALPDSIRDALSLRYERLTEDAQEVVALAAVIAVHASHRLLERLAGLPSESLLKAIDELRRDRIFEEIELADGPAYVFTHPMMQDMLYSELSRARVRSLHAKIADTMDALYGESAMQHAEEIAVHYARADDPQQASRAIRYLTVAGRNALERGAGREAAESLNAALGILERGEAHESLEDVLALLGRARHRLGDYGGATTLWTRAVELAEARGAHGRVATLERRLGVASLRRGDFRGALAHQERGRAAAALARDEAAEASLRLARSSVMMEIGKGEDAQREAELALELAERLGEPRLLGRVYEALQSLAVWRGPGSAVQDHGARALAFARRAGDVRTAWQVEWTFALYAGLTGDSTGTARHLVEATRLADEVRSPLLRLWTAEVAVEYRSGIGEWDEALALADRTIDEARAFGQRMLLPRLLVWSALIHCGRGTFEEAKRRIDEAWVLSGADRLDDHETVNVHTVVPAHVGLAYYHLYRRDYRAALEIGERGLAIADKTGYEVWAVHRLLPLVAEASLWVRDWERSTAYGHRMRDAADRLGNSLARAWSDACVALERMLQGDHAGAITQLRQAADDIDAIPFVEHAARLRRKFADALLVAGRRDDAVIELRRIHDVFSRLRATLSLDDVREKLTELGVRPPPRVSTVGAGMGALTARETEIARLVAARKSNREVGAVLGISDRTVGTHLNNIYAKLGVDSRGALTDVIRALDG